MAETIVGLVIAAFVALLFIWIGISVFSTAPQVSTSPTTTPAPATQVSDSFGGAFVIAGAIGVIAVILALIKMFSS